MRLILLIAGGIAGYLLGGVLTVLAAAVMFRLHGEQADWRWSPASGELPMLKLCLFPWPVVLAVGLVAVVMKGFETASGGLSRAAERIQTPPPPKPKPEPEPPRRGIDVRRGR